MNKPNILMITPYLPYHSQAGGQTRSYYLLKHLAGKNNITLICFTRDKTGLSELKKICKKVILIKRGRTWDIKKVLFTAFSPYPFLVTNYLSPELKTAIQTELAKGIYQLIHTECFYLMPNIPFTSIPIILVDQTIEYAVYQHFVESIKGFKSLIKPFLWLDVFKLKYWETYYWKKTHTVAAVSEDDKRLMSKMANRSDIKLVPNGVAERYFKPKKNIHKTEHPSILFGISNMKWMQNSEGAKLLLQDFWPAIVAAIPKAKLYIIGRYAPQAFSKYSSSHIIVSEADIDGGDKDPQYYYQTSWLLLAPIKSGGGSRTKFFEAMASKLPIVTTKQGMEGINIKNNVHAIICPYSRLATSAIHLLQNQKHRDYIGQNASYLVKKDYSWAKSSTKLNNIYKQLISL